MMPYPIEPHNPYNRGIPRKKTLVELLEEEQIFHQLMLEKIGQQQTVNDSVNNAIGHGSNATGAAAGGVPPASFFKPSIPSNFLNNKIIFDDDNKMPPDIEVDNPSGSYDFSANSNIFGYAVNCPNLIELICDNSPSLSSMNVSGSSNLTDLYCSLCVLTSLTLTGATSLDDLEVWSNHLTSLDLTGISSLIVLTCYINELTSLNVSSQSALQILDCHSNNLTSLDVSHNPQLTELTCYFNSISSLVVTGSTGLTLIDTNHCNLTTFRVKGLTQLSYLDIQHNSLTQNSVDVVLDDLVTYALNNNGTALFAGNALPSNAGFASASLLTNAGWNVILT